MKPPKLDLNLLPVLDAILSHASVGKAAAAVGLSKPAASHALGRIRTQIGDPILVRAGQRWVLTERAAAIAPRVRAALDEARALLAEGRPFEPKELRREFRIHATDECLSLLGLAVGHAVSAAAPHVALRFLPLESDEAGALRSDVDLALGVFHDLPPELLTQKLFDDEFACVLRAGHPKARSKLTLEGYLALKHVVVAPPGRRESAVDEALAQRGLARRAVRWVPYCSSAIEFVAESDCAATISATFARKVAVRYELAVLSPPLGLPPCAATQVWHTRWGADPAHVWLRRLVARTARTARTAHAAPEAASRAARRFTESR
jgi:DNA-binding transcriptional LysR family regulator